ncbi:MAG TPA: hypothetical protein VJ785_13240 [Anaerolineales bacterium]|nr:hypothetical protein [Anaerolineales bacterium]
MNYTVNATVVSSPVGDLISTASVGVPPGITDTNPGDNTATDTDQLVKSSTFPYFSRVSAQRW